MTTQSGKYRLSLASFFTLTTAVAISLGIFVYSPAIFFTLVVVTIPAAFRLHRWSGAAANVGSELTLTDLAVALACEIFICLLLIAGIVVSFVAAAVSVAGYLQYQGTAGLLYTFLIGCAGAMLCGYRLVPELATYPERYAGLHRRLPTYAECARQTCKAVSIHLTVNGAWIAAAVWVHILFPVQPMRSDWHAALAIAALAIHGTIATTAAYRVTQRFFHDGRVRATAGTVVVSAILIPLIVHFKPYLALLAAQLLYATVFFLCIALPGMRWPPLLPARGSALLENERPSDA